VLLNVYIGWSQRALSWQEIRVFSSDDSPQSLLQLNWSWILIDLDKLYLEH